MTNRFWNRYGVLDVIDQNGVAKRFNSNDFYFEFNIVKTQREEPNQSSITITNLSKATRNWIDQNVKYVMIYAGYNGDNIYNTAMPPLLSMGVVSECMHEKNGQDIRTTFTIEDGGEEYKHSGINKAFPSGTSIKSIIEDLGKTMEVASINAKDIDPNAKFESSVTMAGSSRKYLTEVCKSANLEWSIQNGQLQIHAKNWHNGQSYYLSKESGMIGSPQKFKRTKKKSKEEDELVEDQGIRVTSLLLPTLIPSSVVTMSSDIFGRVGYYVAKEVRHSGSPSRQSNSGGYYTEITIQEITAQPNREVVPNSETINQAQNGGSSYKPPKQPILLDLDGVPA